jgi:hypothetical protein
VLRRTFIRLISSSTESHNGDDTTKDRHQNFALSCTQIFQEMSQK